MFQELSKIMDLVYRSSEPRTLRLIGRLHAWLWQLTGGKLDNAFGRAPS